MAGCTLACRLEQEGHPFRLVGSSHLPSAAKVAAGIINPITGRWMTKSWRFDDFAPEARSFYEGIEQRFSVKLYHSLPAVRFFLNGEDAKRAKRRSRNPRYASVLDGFEVSEQEDALFKNSHGGFRIQGAAYVNLPLVIETLRAHFLSDGCYQDCIFDHQELEKGEDGWLYAGENYERVIFCEGAMLKENPWFRDLPLTPAKGETLLCRSDSLKIDEKLYHHGKWLLPYPDGTFRIGATYDEADLTPAPTSGAKNQLSEAFETMMRDEQDLDIIDQPAGLRPSTSDARPFLGTHSTEAGLYIFNGLGSKGASLAPTLSRELLDFVFDDKPLNSDTDIRRFS